MSRYHAHTILVLGGISRESPNLPKSPDRAAAVLYVATAALSDATSPTVTGNRGIGARGDSSPALGITETMEPTPDRCPC